ncbi:Imm8 family immunity protein [Micromonospora parva]|uniref:Imm8 family immunity protein n=1 Tax=Micromonospora parva TaxID=1464048 RepID=UPI0033D19BAB
MAGAALRAVASRRSPQYFGIAMKASVRHFISPDVDIDDFRPDDPENFSFLLQALVGPADSAGEESLQFLVTTPRSLAEAVQSDGVIFGRSLVIVDGPNMPRILDSVRRAIERLEAPSWQLLAQQLTRLGVYEFESEL